MRIPPPTGQRVAAAGSNSAAPDNTPAATTPAPLAVAGSPGSRTRTPARPSAAQAALIAQLRPQRESINDRVTASAVNPEHQRMPQNAAEEQAALIAQLTRQSNAAHQNRPHSNLESFSAEWNEWSREATAPEENRTEAVARMRNLPARGMSPNDQGFTNLNRVRLNLTGLGLTSLPSLPDTIQQLDIRNNRLASLPDRLPASLASLEASGNPLTTVPYSAMALPRESRVIISVNHMTFAVRNQLSQMAHAPNYNGPPIYFDMSTPFFYMGAQSNRPANSLANEINTWISEAPTIGDASNLENRVLPSGSDAASFSRFLGRLRETQEYRNPDTKAHFQQRVRALIDQVQQPDRENLRATCLAQASDALTSCGDRVALSFLDMETQACIDQAERNVQAGHYDDRPAELVKLGQGMFRCEQLQTIAREKVDTLNVVDPIEVHLGYLVQLSREFELPVQVNDMIYPRCTQLNEADLQSARQRLNNDPNHQGLVGYLANFSPMDGYLRRARPEEYAAANSQIETRVATRKSEIQEQLATLEGDSAGYLETSNLLMKEFNSTKAQVSNEVKGALIRTLPGLAGASMERAV